MRKVYRVLTFEFQPTHPHGVRPAARHADRGTKRVSTHAPARGATYISALEQIQALFQPTHPHGVRREGMTELKEDLKFQPTHPHGVRHLCASRWRR